MLVREALLGKAIITAKRTTPVRQAMQLLIEHRISCLPVVADNWELVGIISDKDIFRLIYDNSGVVDNSVVGDHMSTNLIVGLPTDDIEYIATVMTNNRIRHVPIVDGRRLIGLLSVGDIVKTQIDGYVAENRYLRQYIDGKYPA
ncbi:inosine-5-monophosphate dehydrogenase [candidate division GN15 bacterium]|uniref:Inosine-5-monophosphate dehydrogenase n=1 Tax=candidate division GN15 bacterium TaxID=2072418 RepID=A0A855WY15_9BACT|nr:MAG: inosine-5-monophosphate dehydrogenase [candidate division GN15 bacterium]